VGLEGPVARLTTFHTVGSEGRVDSETSSAPRRSSSRLGLQNLFPVGDVLVCPASSGHLW